MCIRDRCSPRAPGRQGTTAPTASRRGAGSRPRRPPPAAVRPPGRRSPGSPRPRARAPTPTRPAGAVQGGASSSAQSCPAGPFDDPRPERRIKPMPTATTAATAPMPTTANTHGWAASGTRVPASVSSSPETAADSSFGCARRSSGSTLGPVEPSLYRQPSNPPAAGTDVSAPSIQTCQVPSWPPYQYDQYEPAKASGQGSGRASLAQIMPCLLYTSDAADD